MLILVEIFILALAIMACAPDTRLGKTLRTWLIDAPVRAAGKTTPTKIIVGAIVFVWLITMAVCAPEIMAMIGLGDLAVYMDAAVIAALMAAAVRMRSVFAQTVNIARTLATRWAARRNRHKPFTRRSRRHRPSLPSLGDEDEPHEGLAFA